MPTPIIYLKARSRGFVNWVLFVYSPYATAETWTPHRAVLDTITHQGLGVLQDASLALTFAILDLHYVLAWPLDNAWRARVTYEPAPLPAPAHDRRATSRAFAAAPRGDTRLDKRAA
jgi:bacteriorhodopsin